MKFLLVDAIKKECRIEDHKELRDAQRTLGLDKVDHGQLARGLGYVVDEFGLFKPKEQQHYWSIGQRLVAGSSVLYAFDEMGESEDIDQAFAENLISKVRFHAGWQDVETDIQHGHTIRPTNSFNGVVTWQWPAPAPKGMME